jgi:hypothetical protein
VPLSFEPFTNIVKCSDNRMNRICVYSGNKNKEGRKKTRKKKCLMEEDKMMIKQRM